jgi:hypothetical protein
MAPKNASERGKKCLKGKIKGEHTLRKQRSGYVVGFGRFLRSKQ